MYDPIEVTDLIRALNGSKTTLKDRSFYEQTIRDSGVYAMDRISIGDCWQVIGALRYARYSARQLYSDPYKTDATTPSFSVTYKLSAKASVYANYV